MPDIKHNQVSDFLKKPQAVRGHAVFLVQGESMLVRQSVAPLIDSLLDGASRDISCEVIDGLLDNVPEVLEQVNTYAMQVGPKVVWFKDAKLFDGGSGQQRIIDQVQAALEGDDMDRAAKSAARLFGKAGLDILTVEPGSTLPAELQPLLDTVGEDAVNRLITICHDRGWTAAAQDYVDTLGKAIEKGFPPNHYLVITTSERVPKNRKLYKSIQSIGVVVDCHVPQGERRADKMAQEVVLRQILDEALHKAGKRIHPSLFAKLIQLTGFNPATFRDNIEKLVDFSGDRQEITAKDMDAVLQRTKNDPIYELTNAIADRNLNASLFYLDALLGADWHPLQMLAALANQIRKLLIAKDFTRSEFGRAWRTGIAYPQFQSSVLPAIQSFDAQVAGQLADWQKDELPKPAGKGKKGAKKGGSELALAPNPSNAYPVYQTLLKSDNYGYSDLVRIMAEISQVDLKLKSSGQDAALLMKHLVMRICRAGTKT